MHHLSKLIGISGGCLLLSGCPFPVSNMGSEKEYQQAKNFTLPYLPQQGKSVIYLSQGYQYVDWVIGAGTLAEGSRYQGSRVFVKTSMGHEYYIGTLRTSSLCFYAPSGNYQIRFENKGAQPAVITSTLIVHDDAINFIALQHNDVTDAILLKKPTLDQGKFFIHSMPPASCIFLQEHKSVKSNET